jgi:putative Ca2+/H+ antiporter (TMEM165/GDT1 family)
MPNLIPISATIRLAELGETTQHATLLFAADRQHQPIMIFMTAALALVVSTAIAVALGTMGERYLTMIPLKLLAGIGFVAIGAWSIWEHVSGA